MATELLAPTVLFQTSGRYRGPQPRSVRPQRHNRRSSSICRRHDVPAT